MSDISRAHAHAHALSCLTLACGAESRGLHMRMGEARGIWGIWGIWGFHTKPGREVCEHQQQMELQRKQIQQTSAKATEHQIAAEVTLLRLYPRALSLLSPSPIARCTP